MSCVRAPPSDQPLKTYDAPWKVWSNAEMGNVQFSHDTTFAGVGKSTPFTRTLAPLGTVSKVSVTLRGSSCRVTVDATPAESVAVRWIMRKEFVAANRSSGAGAVRAMLLPVAGPRYGCVCVL
jgi:hypothetical protein